MPYQIYDKPIKSFLAQYIKPNSRVIDVGCGTGWTALFLAQRKLNCKVDGIEINTLKIHRANEKFVKAKKDHLMVCHLCAAEQLSRRFAHSSFDYAVSIHSLHHYDDVVRSLKEIKKILRPGGKILLGELEQRYAETIDNCPRYSSSKIKDLLKRSGLVIRRFYDAKPGLLLVLAQKRLTGL